MEQPNRTTVLKTVEEPKPELKQKIMEALAGKWRMLPIFVVLTLIFIVFGSISPAFLSVRNIYNLLLQIAQMATISLGLFFLLLIGEIDLSVASSSAVCGLIAAYVATRLGGNMVLCILAAVGTGAFFGFVQGAIVTTFQAPAFLVTLGGQLFFQGLLLRLLPPENFVSIIGLPVTRLTTSTLSLISSNGLVFAATFVMFLLKYQTYRVAVKVGAPANFFKNVMIPTITIAVAGVLFVFLMDSYFGVSVAVAIVLVMIGVMTYVGSQTRFGLYLYAIGGNPQAAIRAGIPVTKVRLAAFVIEGALVGLGGVIAATRVQSVAMASIDMTVQMEAIAAAVLGGASLFGGRGKVWGVLLGALIMGSISNGLFLIGASTAWRFMIAGLILVMAITLDSYIAKASKMGS